MPVTLVFLGCLACGKLLKRLQISSPPLGGQGQVNRLKPSVAPAGEIIETTTRRRSIPVENSESKPTECWEYLTRVEANNEWGNHIVYIHRTEPSPAVPVQKCTQYLVAPDGARVPIWDKEELEFALMRYYGGGKFRFLVKRGPMLITRGELFIEGPPRVIQAPPPDPNAAPATRDSIVTPISGGDPTAAVASRAFDALSTQERTAAEIGFAAMRTGLDAVTRAVDITNRPAQQDSVTSQLLGALISRLTADPMAQMLQFITVIKELNSLAGGGNTNPLVNKVIESAIDRLTNPQPTTAPSTTMGEIIRQAPGLVQGFAEVMREQRMLAEQQTAALAIQRGNPAPIVTAPQVVPNQPAGPAGEGAPTMEFVEKRILQIFQQPISPEQAADDALAFLDGLDPKASAQLANLGETGLMTLFQNRPILKQATANVPRLVAFIRAFVQMHAEDVAAAQAPASAPPPAAPKQELPN